MHVSTNYDRLIGKIDEFIRKYYLNKIVRGSIYLAASLFASYILVTLAEYYGNFSPLVRTLLFYSFIGLNIFILARWIVIPGLSYFRLGKSLSYDQASAIIGTNFSNVQDKLLNTLQLKKLAGENPSRSSLIEAGIDQKIAELSPVPFASAVKLKENRRYIKYAAVPFLVILVIAFTAPSIFSESTERLLAYNKKFVKKAPFSFVILNDKLSAVQGEDFVLEVKLTGNEIPRDIYVEDGPNTFRLDKESIVKFSYTFKNVQQTKNIRLHAGEFSSDDYTLNVKKRPSLMNADVYLEYPAYLGKQNETVSNAGDLIVPAGTRINWTFKTQNTSSIRLGISDRIVNLQPSGNNGFKFGYRAMTSGNYFILPENNEVTNSDSVSYKLDVIPDLSPVIEMNEQADSVNTKVLYFVGQVNDDHGFSRLNFNYRVLDPSATTKNNVKAVPFQKNGLQSNFFFAWNTGDIQVKPGEQLEYYFEVFDNDGVNGPKSSRTAVKTMRLPTEAEMQKAIEASSEAVKNQMEQAIRKASQIEKDAKKINQDLMNKKELSFEEKKQIEKLLEKQSELENLVKNIQKENKQNNFNQQNQNREQSKELLEKQKQIEDLFNNVLDEKTREMLKNIQRMLEQNNKNMTQQELSKMQMDNKSLQKELDRILELYKQLEFDQKLAQTIDQLKEQAKEQKKLSEQSAPKDKDGTKDKDAAKNKDESGKNPQDQADKNKNQEKPDSQRQKEADAQKQQNQDAQKQPNADQQKQNAAQEQKKLTPEEQKQKQDELNKAFEDLKEQLKELEKKNEELSDKGNFKNPENQQEKIQQQQQQSSKNLEKKDMRKASESQEDAAEEMEKLSEKLEQMQQEQEEQENEVNMQDLREILDKLVTSSFDQEKVMQTLKNTRTGDPSYVNLTQKQKDILDNLKSVQDSLYELSKKVPQIQSVVNKEIRDINLNIQSALSLLAERRTPEASSAQQYAMTAINNLALMLSEAQEQMQNAKQQKGKPGKGKSKRPSLSQLSKMQQQLNQNMQKAREQMQREGQQPGRQPGQQPGQRPGQGQGQGNGQMSEQLARMAREQQMIRQALQEINREQNKDGKNGLGNLDQMAKEMEQSETDLVNKRIQQETLIRQQEILTKLLDAEKAEREREEDNKRESKEGKDMAPNYKLVLEQYKKIKQRETELLKTVPPSLNSFYKIKVGDYFKSLNSGK
ncbi:DUF4175 family protein [Hufsiella ginkgonis]|uniref:DUF4175 family protein n=1 Tax=Hufsiella ginkgonis TaxID=2695274 RepID=A0A7K1XUM7_9SPHI|nr:DUF4175 family protein [Hufsiella ginkgonis]MXV14713.1 hypothetical protein [Hufsiella ginkgonis]